MDLLQKYSPTAAPLKKIGAWIWLVFLFSPPLLAQNFVQLEYFIDTDPDYGLGTQVEITSDTTLDLEFNASLADVPDGFHYLIVRAKTAEGHWTNSFIRPFFKSTLDTTTVVNTFPDIVQLEYFIDTDPGYGLAMQVPITPDTTIDTTFNASLAGVPDGFHYLSVRARDASGQWTNSFIRPFLKSTISSGPPATPDSIISIHYAIEKDGAELLSGTYSGFSPATNLDFEFNIDVSGLLPDSTYLLRTYVMDTGNDQSFAQTDSIEIISPLLEAVNDIASIPEDSLVTIDVLANDITESGDTLSVVRVSEAPNGQASLNADNTVTYTPNEDFHGTDSFIYVMSDKYYGEDSAQVIVTVLPVNDAPVIISSAVAQAWEFGYFSYSGMATDVDDLTLSWSFTDLPSWLIHNAETDSVFGTPPDGAIDTSFQAIVSDGELSDTLLVLVYVKPENRPPESFSLISPSDSADVLTLIPLLDWSFAFDPDLGDTVRYTLYLDTPAQGVVTIPTDTTSSFQITGPLNDNTTYFWKVAASDLAGAVTENTGGYHSFRVNTVEDPPSEFALLSPAEGSMIADLTPAFLWQESVDPDDPSGIFYRFYLGTDALFTDVTPIEMDTTGYARSMELQEDVIYYWKVVAVDASGL
ncbi:MAG: cadherin-like domain-containing protein, partial [Candidatus Neomarinimicrobiota bacterium]